MLYWISPWMEGDRRKCNGVSHFPSPLHFCKLAKVMVSCNLTFLPSVHCQYRQRVLLETLLQRAVTPMNHWRQDSYVLGFQLRGRYDFIEGCSYMMETEEFLIRLFFVLFAYFERRSHGKMNSWKDLGFLPYLSLSSLKRTFLKSSFFCVCCPRVFSLDTENGSSMSQI